jgi:hypothetical protein
MKDENGKISNNWLMHMRSLLEEESPEYKKFLEGMQTIEPTITIEQSIKEPCLEDYVIEYTSRIEARLKELDEEYLDLMMKERLLEFVNHNAWKKPDQKSSKSISNIGMSLPDRFLKCVKIMKDK